MAFTVEDGTGLAAANAYTAVAFVDSYFADRGITDWAGSDTIKQQAIVKATDYVDNRFRGQFKGDIFDSAQGLEWPRAYVYDHNGVELEGIPTALKKAIAEYALRALSAELMPDPTTEDTGQTVKLKKEVVGPIEETTLYQDGSTRNLIKPYPAADRLLFGLLKGAQGRVHRG